MDQAEPTKPKENRKLAAVMFTDIVGYSRMMNQDEAGTLQFLSLHNAILDAQVKAHKGRVIKTIGDSYMVDFTSVVDAVTCAVAIQSQLHARNQNLKTPLKRYIRIGIHLGDVVVTGKDIFGEGVNIAARLEPLSPYGGICVSREVAAHLKGLRHIKVIPRGLQSLKNISHPVAVFQLWAQGMDPTASRRFHAFKKKIQRWRLALGLAALALFTGLGLLPRWVERGQAQVWETWMRENFQDHSAFSRRWAAQGVDFHAGYAHLNGGWISLKKQVPVRAFRVDVTYRTLPGRGGLLALAAAGLGEKDSELKGLYSRQRFDPATFWTEERLGQGQGAAADESAFDHDDSPSVGRHRKSFIYADGRLWIQSDQDSWWRRVRPAANPRHTWVRRAPAGGFFRFAVQAEGIRVESVTVSFKRANSEDDLHTRAGDQALDGRAGMASKIYEDLLAVSQDAQEQSGYLYRRALVARSLGQARTAVNLYQRILKNYPENLYSAHARLDLGLMESQAARAAKKDSDRERSYKNAVGYFNGLVNRQGGHAQAARANFLALEIQAEELGGGADALPGLLKIANQGEAYSVMAFEAWINGLKALRDDAKAGDLLEEQIEEEDLEDFLLERAALEAARFHRQAGRFGPLAARAIASCKKGAAGLPARRAVVRQWVLAEEDGRFLARDMDALVAALKEDEAAALRFYRAYLLENGRRMAAAASRFLAKAQRVALEEAAKDDPKRRRYLDWTHSDVRIRHGGPGAALAPREEEGWSLELKGAPAEGLRVSMAPGVPPYSVEGPQGKAVDVSIYRSMSFKARAPKGLRYRVHLAEWGADSPALSYAPGPQDSDAEQVVYGTWTGTGLWQRYKLDLEKAMPDLDWGNQQGDGLLQLKALAAVVVSVSGGAAKGTLEFKDVYFER